MLHLSEKYFVYLIGKKKEMIQLEQQKKKAKTK